MLFGVFEHISPHWFGTRGKQRKYESEHVLRSNIFFGSYSLLSPFLSSVVRTPFLYLQIFDLFERDFVPATSKWRNNTGIDKTYTFCEFDYYIGIDLL